MTDIYKGIIIAAVCIIIGIVTEYAVISITDLTFPNVWNSFQVAPDTPFYTLDYNLMIIAGLHLIPIIIAGGGILNLFLTAIKKQRVDWESRN